MIFMGKFDSPFFHFLCNTILCGTKKLIPLLTGYQLFYFTTLKVLKILPSGLHTRCAVRAVPNRCFAVCF